MKRFSSVLLAVLPILMWPLLATDCYRREDPTPADKQRFEGSWTYHPVDSLLPAYPISILRNTNDQYARDFLLLGLRSSSDSLEGEAHKTNGWVTLGFKNIRTLVTDSLWSCSAEFGATGEDSLLFSLWLGNDSPYYRPIGVATR